MSTTIHKVYDLCIVGAGPMGSAAARHATLIDPHLKVCLIGPKEPQNRFEYSNEIFGSHYDEGRILTALLYDPIWNKLSRRTLDRCRDLEKRTGIAFLTIRSQLFIGRNSDPHMENICQAAANMKEAAQILDRDVVSKRYPYLSVRLSDDVIVHTEEGGFVSPRKLVLAQQTAANLQGCDIFDDVVDQVTELDQSDSLKRMVVTTVNGQTYLARKVLLTPGAFIGFRNLLPPKKELDLTPLKQDLAFIELGEKDVTRLRKMPVVMWKDQVDKVHCYILPPIQYPNGKHYIKIGRRTTDELRTQKEVVDYLKRDPAELVADPQLMNLLLELVGDIKVISTHGDSCVTGHTPTGMLYCDMVTPRLGVAVAGNGYGVMASDEIGNMAARMVISGSWDHDLPRERFRAKFRAKPKVSSKL
ncbi:monomeric sarcosine oxidase-like [Ptychodera flava]|uniref:monomeric sarcosine oxidase-like n=1 Tax=Ptychodera flava TaxID=63121 RepID=UPI003969EABB